MKSSKIHFAIFIAAYLLFASLLYAQDIFAYKFIGKSRSDVIKQYGKPVHMDNSDPTMVCMFYKKNSNQMIFVADQNSVFQVEVTKAFTSKTDAVNSLDDLLNTAMKESFIPDTLSANEYKLQKTDVSINAWLMNNSNLSTFEVRIKAMRK